MFGEMTGLSLVRGFGGARSHTAWLWEPRGLKRTKEEETEAVNEPQLHEPVGTAR